MELFPLIVKIPIESNLVTVKKNHLKTKRVVNKLPDYPRIRKDIFFLALKKFATFDWKLSGKFELSFTTFS